LRSEGGKRKFEFRKRKRTGESANETKPQRTGKGAAPTGVLEKWCRVPTGDVLKRAGFLLLTGTYKKVKKIERKGKEQGGGGGKKHKVERNDSTWRADTHRKGWVVDKKRGGVGWGAIKIGGGCGHRNSLDNRNRWTKGDRRRA